MSTAPTDQRYGLSAFRTGHRNVFLYVRPLPTRRVGRVGSVCGYVCTCVCICVCEYVWRTAREHLTKVGRHNAPREGASACTYFLPGVQCRQLMRSRGPPARRERRVQRPHQPTWLENEAREESSCEKASLGRFLLGARGNERLTTDYIGRLHVHRALC